MILKWLRWAALALAMALGLSACGQYQGWTRYECQLFENWQNPECNPPQCKVQGICTSDIIGETTPDETP